MSDERPDPMLERINEDLLDASSKIVAAETERCAKIAEVVGKRLGEPSIGYAIARQIRNSTPEAS